MSVVEVVGMVGAGKSTLTSEMTNLLERRGYVVLTRVEAIRVAMRRSLVGSLCSRFVRSAARRDRILIAAYRLAVRPAYIGVFAVRNLGLIRSVIGSHALRWLPRWHRRTISKLLYRTGASVGFLSSRLRPHEVLILEEGLHHRAVNLFSWDPNGVDAARVDSYVRAVPATDLVISVEAPPAVCVARARSRGLPNRLESQSAIEPDRFLANAAEVIEIVLRTLDAGTHPALRIWNGDSLEEAVAALDSGLNAYFEPRPL